MPMLDIFTSDAFGVVPLTDAINNTLFVPGRIGQMGLFTESAIASLSVAIETKDDLLILVPPTPRGGPGVTIDKNKRKLRMLAVPHFEINDAIMADEVQGVRAWGTESDVEMVMDKVAERQAIHAQSFAATEEYARLGAITGVITYADSSTLDLFNEFDVTQEAEVDFDLDNATPAAGALRKKVASVARLIANNLGNIPYSYIHAFCGDAFFDDLLAHVEVRNSFLNTPMAAVLRDGYLAPNGSKIFGAFEFGGVVWENYRGVVGGTSFINTDKAYLFPVGVPGLFKTVYAPADYVETVNRPGQRLYSKQYVMPNDKGVHFDTQSNQLHYVTRPKVLIKGKRT